MIVVLGSAFLLWILFTSEEERTPFISLGFGIAVIGAWIHGWFYWTSPWKVIIDGDVLAAYWHCKNKQWQVAELRKRDPGTWFSSLIGAKEFVYQSGTLQFRVWKEIKGSKALFAAIPDENRK